MAKQKVKKKKTKRTDSGKNITFYMPDESLKANLDKWLKTQDRTRSQGISLIIRRTLPLFQSGELKLEG